MSSKVSLVSEDEQKCMEIVSIEQLYDEYDLSKWSLFSGGFINFGYWEEINTHNEISTEERLESERNLYRCVLKKLDISSRDNILEVACGLGLGCSLLIKEFPVQKITGIDISPAQIKRAKKLNEELLSSSKKLEFQIGKAENIPFKDACFSKLFSIEAIQHFLSVYDFANEAFQVIKPKGRLAVASFFATNAHSTPEIKKMIKTVQDGIDNLIPITSIKQILEEAGFIDIHVEKIGRFVWDAFDKWISQGEFADTWNRNWLKAYHRNLLDYYIITAEKPDLE